MVDESGAEKTKRLVGFKGNLEKKVEQLETELKDAQAMLETVNSILLEKGFKHPQITKKNSSIQEASPKQEITSEAGYTVEPLTAPENVVPLNAATGELLAILHTSENSLRVLPAEDKKFNVNTPPFAQFLVERVLVKMQERDSELARAGQLSTDRIFSYNILREGDTIHEILIKNIDAERLKELRSSIRWTLEKMYEKMQSKDQ
jgi:hypothetical protein